MIRLIGTKFLPIFLLLAFIAVACTRQDDVFSKDRIDSEILAFSTKTALIVGDNSIKSVWNEGDRIGVFGEESGKNLPYILEEGAGANKATFVSEAASCEGLKMAYYPYSMHASSIGNAGFYFPNVQNFIDGVPDPEAAFMISPTFSDKLTFKNVFSILGLSIKSSVRRDISQIVFRDKSGKNVSGEFFIVPGANGVLNVEFSDGDKLSDSKIVLKADASGVSIGADFYTHFYIFIPPRSYEKGFSLDFITTDGDIMTKEVGKNGVEIRNSVFYEMPPIDDFIQNEERRQWGGFMLKGVTPEKGWFDVNKLHTKSYSEDGELIGDSYLCWAAATSNILDWWQASLDPESIPANAPYGAYVLDGKPLATGNSAKGQSNVFRYFTKLTINSGNFMTNGLDWFLNHSSAIPIQKKYEEDPNIGGFYKEIMGTDRHTEMVQWWAGSTKKEAMNFVKGQLERAVNNNWGINLNYSIGGGGHAVTCWGYELGDQELSAMLTSEDQILTQERLNANNGGDFVKYVYLTDSDDAFDSPNNSLIRAGVVYMDNGEILIIYNGGARRKLMSFIYGKF